MLPYVLAAMMLSHPGAIDRDGGHLSFDGKYHYHSGASFQFRYVDATGRLWEGQGPRPEENLLSEREDMLWQTAFIPMLIIVAFIGLGVSLKVETWMKNMHYSARIRRKLHARDFEPMPVLAASGVHYRPRISARRRANVRRSARDRRFGHDRRLASRHR